MNAYSRASSFLTKRKDPHTSAEAKGEEISQKQAREQKLSKHVSKLLRVEPLI